MNQKRVLNILLVVVAVLLLVNLGMTLFPVAHAIPKTQYRVIQLPAFGGTRENLEKALNQQTEEGWTYVNGDGPLLIFKK
jgi:hypothetical protein